MSDKADKKTDKYILIDTIVNDISTIAKDKGIVDLSTMAMALHEVNGGEDDNKECKNCNMSLSLDYPLEWGDSPYYCGACMTDKFDEARKVVTKVADEIWAIAEGKADGSERNLKRISGVLHDIRAGRDTDWYMK